MTYLSKLMICYKWQLNPKRWRKLLGEFGEHWINLIKFILAVISFLPLTFFFQFIHPIYIAARLNDGQAERLKDIVK